MSLEIFLQSIINGLFVGGIYSLVSIGLTLIYGVLKIINFAHGEFLMLGMYVAFWMFTLFGIHPYVSLFLALFLLFLTGVLIQKVLIEKVISAPTLNQVLLLLGLSTFLVGISQMAFTADPRTIILPFSLERFKLGDFIFNKPRTYAFIVSLTIAGLLYAFLKYSKFGKAIRACSINRDAASLVGINVKKMYMLTFGIGAAVTGIAGALLIPSYPVTPTTGVQFSTIAFVVVVLGSLGNFVGAFVGGLLIGIAETFGGFFIGSDMKDVISMAIFILVLLFRPQGLFGKGKLS